jgi:hypothetical protein
MIGPRVAVLIIFAVALACPAAEPPKLIAAGDWSKPVADRRGRAVRGRLIVCEKPAAGELRETVLYVELQDASEAVGATIHLYCEMDKHDFRPESKGGLDCELRDKSGRSIKPTSFPFGGAVPKSEWVMLPSDATIRLRATPFGLRRAKAKAICPHLGTLWVINDGDPNEYFLSGTFTINPPDDHKLAGDEPVWRGTIELPAVKLGG